MVGAVNGAEQIVQSERVRQEDVPGHDAERGLRRRGLGRDRLGVYAQLLTQLPVQLVEGAAQPVTSFFHRFIMRVLDPLHEPAPPHPLSRRELVRKRSQPGELHLRIATAVRGAGQVPDSVTHLAGHASMELGAVGPQRASQATQGNPEIVQRLPIRRIVEPGQGGATLLEVIQGHEPGSFGPGPDDQIGGKSAHVNPRADGAAQARGPTPAWHSRLSPPNRNATGRPPPS
jgi:hypothetical protein